MAGVTARARATVLAGRYTDALRDYCATAAESALAEAHDVGREALAAGLGPMWLLRVHQAALADVLEDATDSGDAVRRACRAGDALLGTAAPFEFAHHRYSQLTGTVDHLRGELRQQRAVAARLRNADEVKNSFLRALSHELRSPLTSVLGFAETLNRRDIDLGAQRRITLIERLASRAAKLDRLLEDLLDVDRLTHDVVTITRTDTRVDRLVAHVLDEVVPPSEPVERDLHPCAVPVDAPKVERIVENLVTNALRHTPPGTPVRIGLEPRHDGCLLAVEDRGVGIPDELKSALFEPFRQAAGPAANGTGIGLTLVAGFAELHGGRAWVEDRPGGGARFCVHLPGTATAGAG